MFSGTEQEICHNYPLRGIYTVEFTNPESMIELNFDDKTKIANFQK